MKDETTRPPAGSLAAQQRKFNVFINRIRLGLRRRSSGIKCDTGERKRRHNGGFHQGSVDWQQDGVHMEELVTPLE